jgi:hypothetical protein
MADFRPARQHTAAESGLKMTRAADIAVGEKHNAGQFYRGFSAHGMRLFLTVIVPQSDFPGPSLHPEGSNRKKTPYFAFSTQRKPKVFFWSLGVQ